MIDIHYSSYSFLASELKWWLVSTSFKIYLEILSNFYITFTIFNYNTISLKCTFFPVLVKGLYQTESYSLHVILLDRERDIKVWKNFKVYFKWGWNKSPFDINSVVFHFDDFNYGRRSQPNLHSSTIFLLNVVTVPTVWYIFFHFIIGYEKNQLSCNCQKKYGCDRLP
jgi:hypothetical protein